MQPDAQSGWEAGRLEGIGTWIKASDIWRRLQRKIASNRYHDDHIVHIIIIIVTNPSTHTFRMISVAINT